MRPLYTSLNTAHSGCKLSSSVSSFTHSLHVFLPRPTYLTPATTTFLQADTQSSPFLRSTCPNHLNLPCLTTFATLWMPQRLVQDLTLLPILQRHTTHPSHHHALCSLQVMQILSLHCPCLTTICQHALDTGPKNLPLHAMWHTTGPSEWAIAPCSLNLAQAHRTLALAASSTPPPAPSVSPK